MPPPGRQIRKRERDSDEEGSSAAVARPSKAVAGKVATFSTAPPSTAADAVRNTTAIASDRSAAPHSYGGGAFASTEIDTAADRDGRALLERKLALQAEAREAATAADGKVPPQLGRATTYRGLAAYNNFSGVEKDASTAVSQSKVSGTHGPLRAPTHVRGTVRIDYAPDVCKDYKETGFCGFGDSCKFLHDRGDYKMGWQLDKEWDAKEAAKAAALAAHVAGGGDAADFDPSSSDAANPFAIREEADADVDGLPFACHICRGDFTAPVVTTCGHYFCERCATARYGAGDPYCAVCGKQTHGIFNVSARLVARLARRAASAADAEAGGSTADGPRSGRAARKADVGSWTIQ